MTLDDFRRSLTATNPPHELTHALAGLWWDAKGDWTRAHESAQQDEGADGSWVHAYLHRKEGDQGSAAYWYGRAASRFAKSHSMRNGSVLRGFCWDNVPVQILWSYFSGNFVDVAPSRLSKGGSTKRQTEAAERSKARTERTPCNSSDS